MPSEIGSDEHVALAMAAITVAFARTLIEMFPEEDDALSVLQRKMQGALSQLRQSHGQSLDTERATAIFRVARDALRNLEITEESGE